MSGISSSRRWLGRLAFSLLIVGGLLGWFAYQTLTGQRPGEAWRGWLYVVGAAALISLGMAGLRERHRPDDEGDQDG